MNQVKLGYETDVPSHVTDVALGFSMDNVFLFDNSSFLSTNNDGTAVAVYLNHNVRKVYSNVRIDLKIDNQTATVLK